MDEEPVIVKYFASALWTLAQINGNTDTSTERPMLEQGAVLFLALFFVVFMTFFIGSLTTKMMELHKSRQQTQLGTRLLNSYLEHHQLDSAFAFSAKLYMSSQLQLDRSSANEQQILSLLPPQLKHELLYQVRHRLIITQPFFEHFNETFEDVMREVCLDAPKGALEQYAVGATALVSEKGTRSTQIMFVIEGEIGYAPNHRGTPGILELSSCASDRTSSVAAQVVRLSMPLCLDTPARGTTKHSADIFETFVRSGAWLSEPALFIEWRKQGTLIATTGCNLLTLDSKDLKKVLEGHPPAAARVALYAWCYAVAVKELLDDDITITDLDRIAIARPKSDDLAEYPVVPSPGQAPSPKASITEQIGSMFAQLDARSKIML